MYIYELVIFLLQLLLQNVIILSLVATNKIMFIAFEMNKFAAYRHCRLYVPTITEEIKRKFKSF